MKSFVLLLLSTLAVFGQVPSFKSFNPAQFNTNNFIVSIKDGATLTNITIRNSLTLPSLPDSTITLNGVTITNWTDIGPVETNSLWIEIAGVLQPLVGNQVLVTNLSSQNVLSALGAFTMPASYSTNLTAGTNCLNPYNLGSVWITGADATAAGSSISLVSGNGQGQLLILQNYSTNSGFTMYNGIPFCDGSGGFIRLNGDWTTTNRGDTLFLYNTGQIWTEVGRAYASTNSIADNVWVNESGHIHPVDGNANNVLTFTSGLADNATNVAMVVGTTNYWSASGSLLARFDNGNTNRVTIAANGAIIQGPSTMAFTSFPPNGVVLYSFNDTRVGEDAFKDLYFGVIDSGGNEQSFDFFSSDTQVRARLIGGPSGITLTTLEPTVASSGSATAYLFDTSNYLNTSGDLLAAFKNAGTNRVWFQPNGAINIGQDSENQWGPSHGVVSFFDTSLGDPYYNEIVAGVTDGGSLYRTISWNIDTNINSRSLEFAMVNGPSELLMFRPMEISSGSAIAYKFDTSNTLTNGDKLVSIRNAGVEQLRVANNGGIYLGEGAYDWEGSISPTIAVVSQADVYGNDGSAGFVFEALNNTSSINADTHNQFVGSIATNLLSLVLRNQTSGNLTVLNPLIVDTNNPMPYIFDTKNSITSTNGLLASFRNAGTRYLDIDKTGVLLFGPGTTNTLFRSDSNLVYHNNDTAGFGFQLQGPTGTGSIQNSDGAGTMKIQANTSRAIFLSPDNGSVDYVALSASFKPDVLGKDLGDSSSNGRWNNFHLDGKITWNGTTNSVFDLAGSGSPEGVVTASPGSTYRNFSGGSLTTFWVKESGTGNTGWIGK